MTTSTTTTTKTKQQRKGDASLFARTCFPSLSSAVGPAHLDFFTSLHRSFSFGVRLLSIPRTYSSPFQLRRWFTSRIAFNWGSSTIFLRPFPQPTVPKSARYSIPFLRIVAFFFFLFFFFLFFCFSLFFVMVFIFSNFWQPSKTINTHLTLIQSLKDNHTSFLTS